MLAMETFLEKHSGALLGSLSGIDRIVFRGLFRQLSYVDGFSGFLGGHGVLRKNFKPFVDRVSDQLVAHAKAMAKSQRREYRYLESSRFSKEDIARHIMERDQIKEGLICVLFCVEPCRSSKEKTLDLVSQERKCLHLYFYVGVQSGKVVSRGFRFVCN